MVNGLDRLRLDAVVGRDHDHRDIRDAGTTGTHGGERLVARGIQEGDDVVGVVDLVRADVLRDAAGLASGHVLVGGADRVEERGLAVVDVTHDRDHRRADLEIVVVVLELGRLRVLVTDGDDLDLAIELAREHLDGLVGERLRERRHLTEHHQLLDDLGDANAEVLGDVLDRGTRGDLDQIGLLVCCRVRACRPSLR